MRTNKPLLTFLAIPALAAGSALVALPASAGAPVIADGDAGSIRSLVDDANLNPGPDTVVLQAGAVYELTVCASDDDNTAGDLDSFEGALTIEGNGATIRQTCDGERVLHHSVEDELELHDVTITDGNTDEDGGGILTNGPTVVRDTTVVGNTSATLGGGLYGFDHPLEVVRSTFDGNAADEGGAIYNYGDVTMTNSTVVGNAATSEGGGVRLPAYDLITEFVTIAGNDSPDGANVFLQGGDLAAFATVIADPVGGGENCASVNAGSLGFNFEAGSDTCALEDQTDEIDGADAQLGALADNGGATRTLEPASTSPLVDVVPVADARCGDDDQRLLARPAGDGCEIGAIEIPAPTPPTTVPTTVPTPPAETPPALPTPATPTFTG